MDAAALRASSERLGVRLRELDAHQDGSVQEGVREVVALLMDLHREALARVLALASDTTLGGPALLGRLADDVLIGPLLLMHDVHPYDVPVRLSRALDRLRPRIAAKGCRAALAGIEGTVARVRLESHAGLSGASELHRTVESALLDAAPELSSVVVEFTDPPRSAPPPLLQIIRPGVTPAPAGDPP